MPDRELLERLAQLPQRRLALLAAELQSRLERYAEPVAVIGLGCRFPGGATDPDSFWDLLLNQRDAISEVPPERWTMDAEGSRWGGFMADIDRFDAQFFGIAPREALMMDPQQRLLLEVAWDALENAGYASETLAGTMTGVFVGISNGDYYRLLLDGQAIDAYSATGSAYSVASGRLSYVLGLQGPSLSVDTACSSSLVALHLAVQSLRSGECRLALAGGVNVILSPETTTALVRANMLAADGRCKTF